MSTPQRRKLIKALGAMTTKDWNSMKEVEQGRILYTMLTGFKFGDTDVPEEEEEIPASIQANKEVLQKRMKQA